MPVFPKVELDVVSLANSMLAGYAANPTIFVHGDSVAVTAVRDDASLALATVMCTQAQSKQATEDKDTAGDPVKLEWIRWGAKAPAQPQFPPNQPRSLEAIMQGPGTVYLDWKPPKIGTKGGPVRTYVIYKREQPLGGGTFGPWQQHGIALTTNCLLSNQTLRCEIEYRILAINSAGISIPSNSAMVVL